MDVVVVVVTPATECRFAAVIDAKLDDGLQSKSHSFLSMLSAENELQAVRISRILYTGQYVVVAAVIVDIGVVAVTVTVGVVPTTMLVLELVFALVIPVAVLIKLFDVQLFCMASSSCGWHSLR